MLGIKNADQLVAVPEDQKPKDPISENMNALKGVPMKAFLYQDHDAHIAVHQSFMQDPMIMATIGQSPAAQQVMGALQAHIAEHLGYQYRKQIEERLGVPMTAPDTELSPDIEVQLSRLVAQAAVQLTQMHQQQAAQQQAQQQAQDPLVQIQQAELQIKQAEVQRKVQNDQMDFQIQQQKLQIEQQRLALETQKNQGEPPQMKAMRAQQELQQKQAKAQQEMQQKEQAHQMKMRQQAQAQAMKAAQQARQQAQRTPKG